MASVRQVSPTTAACTWTGKSSHQWAATMKQQWSWRQPIPTCIACVAPKRGCVGRRVCPSPHVSTSRMLDVDSQLGVRFTMPRSSAQALELLSESTMPQHLIYGVTRTLETAEWQPVLIPACIKTSEPTVN